MIEEDQEDPDDNEVDEDPMERELRIIADKRAERLVLNKYPDPNFRIFQNFKVEAKKAKEDPINSA